MQHGYEVRACRLSYPELTAESGSLSMQLEINASASLFSEITDMGFRLNRIEVRETDSSVVVYTRDDWVDGVRGPRALWLTRRSSNSLQPVGLQLIRSLADFAHLLLLPFRIDVLHLHIPAVVALELPVMSIQEVPVEC